jgi:O-methyltransferase involved in polyketide biosynthesis
VGANAASGSTIIFDYQHLSGLTRAQAQRNYTYAALSRLTGERRSFGIEKSQIKDFLTRKGFTHVVDVNAEQLKRLYCTGPKQGRTVAETYAIVHAEVGESQV